MEQKKSEAPKKGRPPVLKKQETTVRVEGDYLVITIPKKEVSRKLLAELL